MIKQYQSLPGDSTETTYTFGLGHLSELYAVFMGSARISLAWPLEAESDGPAVFCGAGMTLNSPDMTPVHGSMKPGHFSFDVLSRILENEILNDVTDNFDGVFEGVDEVSGVSQIPYSGGAYLLGQARKLSFVDRIFWERDSEDTIIYVLGFAPSRVEEDRFYDVVAETLGAYQDTGNPVEIRFINLCDYSRSEHGQFPFANWHLAYAPLNPGDRTWALAA